MSDLLRVIDATVLGGETHRVSDLGITQPSSVRMRCSRSPSATAIMSWRWPRPRRMATAVAAISNVRTAPMLSRLVSVDRVASTPSSGAVSTSIRESLPALGVEGPHVAEDLRPGEHAVETGAEQVEGGVVLDHEQPADRSVPCSGHLPPVLLAMIHPPGQVPILKEYWRSSFSHRVDRIHTRHRHDQPIPVDRGPADENALPVGSTRRHAPLGRAQAASCSMPKAAGMVFSSPVMVERGPQLMGSTCNGVSHSPPLTWTVVPSANGRPPTDGMRPSPVPAAAACIGAAGSRPS